MHDCTQKFDDFPSSSCHSGERGIPRRGPLKKRSSEAAIIYLAKSNAFVAFAFYALPAVTTTDNHMSSCRVGDTIYKPALGPYMPPNYNKRY